jgi:hypothetical protein
MSQLEVLHRIHEERKTRQMAMRLSGVISLLQLFQFRETRRRLAGEDRAGKRTKAGYGVCIFVTLLPFKKFRV